MRLSALVSVSVLALLPIGCGDSTPEPEVAPGSCPPGQYCAPPAPLVTATTAPPPASSAPTNSMATPIAATLATPLITSAAGEEVKGMQPEGGAFAGQFQEGQILEQPINLAPGKCYAVVGVSLLGVQELDVQIAAQPVPQLPAATLAQDNQTGGIAIVGGRGNCWKNAAPLPITGKVILKVTKGAGIAGGQIYVK